MLLCENLSHDHCIRMPSLLTGIHVLVYPIGNATTGIHSVCARFLYSKQGLKVSQMGV